MFRTRSNSIISRNTDQLVVAAGVASPRMGRVLNRATKASTQEDGAITVEAVIFYAIAAAGAFAIAVLVYNRLKGHANTRLSDANLNNPGPLPAEG